MYITKRYLLAFIVSFTFLTFHSNAQNSLKSTLTTNELLGQVNTITTSVPFLMIAPDARSGAMGDAGVASTPDANSLHWNPAKYAFIEKNMGVSVSYSPWLRALVNDINLAYISGYKRIDDNQTVAVSLLYFSLGDITFTNIVGEVTGQFKPNEFAVDAAYSRKFSENMSGGVSLRYIRSDLTCGQYVEGNPSHPGNAIATDVSVYYQKDIEIANQQGLLALGANISNIGNKISYTETTERDFIPTNMRIGASYTSDLDEYNSLSFLFDISKLLVPTPPVYYSDSSDVVQYGKSPDVSLVSGMFQSFSDAPGGFKEEMHELTYSVGTEYWYNKQFAIRAGYFYEHKNKGNRKFFTVGAGLKYNVFGLDFAYLIPTDQHNPLENTLRFSLLFDFDAFAEQNKPSFSDQNKNKK
jgi:hypothetical protein